MRNLQDLILVLQGSPFGKMAPLNPTILKSNVIVDAAVMHMLHKKLPVWYSMQE